MNLKNAVVSAAGAATATILAGCGLSPGDRVLPGATGTGDDGYEVTIQLADVGNLVTNSEVKVNDKTVGTVKSIELDGWNATIKVGILDTVRLPADAEARIGQKSLLGSEYVELSAPDSERSTAAKNSPAVFFATEPSIRCPTPPIMPPTTASAS